MIPQINCSLNRKYLQTQSRGKTWAVTEDKTVKIATMTSEYIDKALNVMRESCFIGENLCKAVDLLDESEAAEELITTCRDAAEDGVSLVAVNVKTDSVVGVSFNKIHVHTPKTKSYYEVLSENSKFKSSKAFFDFTIAVDNRADVFNHYKVDTVLEVMYLVVMPDFKQKKVGKLLVFSTIELVKQLNEKKVVKTPIDGDGKGINTHGVAIPELIVAMTTSNYSHKIFKKVGSEMAVEVNYEDFTYNGRKYSGKIGNIHKTCRVCYC